MKQKIEVRITGMRGNYCIQLFRGQTSEAVLMKSIKKHDEAERIKGCFDNMYALGVITGMESCASGIETAMQKFVNEGVL